MTGHEIESFADHPVCLPSTEEHVSRIWSARWGSFVVSPCRIYRPEDVEGLVLMDRNGRTRGLVTWDRLLGRDPGDPGGNDSPGPLDPPGRVELVSLDAVEPGHGQGTLLMNAAEQKLRSRGVGELFLYTTNDNLKALAFYVRRGFRLMNVHLDAMDRVRRLKPDVAKTGIDGIPLQDTWELAKSLEE